MQYGSLTDPNFGDEKHDKLVRELVECASEIRYDSKPEARRKVYYSTEHTRYPAEYDMHGNGQLGRQEGETLDAWLERNREMRKNGGKRSGALHPLCTHLIFYNASHVPPEKGEQSESACPMTYTHPL